MRGWATALGLVMACITLTLPEILSDDDRSPAASADSLLILKRLDALEERVAALEAVGQPITVEVSDEKPILQISSADWCAPCQLAKREFAAIKDLPIALKYERWPDAPTTIPAFRYTDKTGIVRVKTGYSPGAWKSILADMGFPR